MSEPQERPQPPSGLADAITREMALKALLEEVKGAYEEARTDVQFELDAEQKRSGGTKFDGVLPGGVKAASVSLTQGEKAAKVTDAEAFEAWAKEAFPSEWMVRVVKEVRPAWLAQVLAEMTAAGVAQVVDTATGEVHDVPGVEIKPSRPRGHALTFARKSKAQPLTGRELVAEAWRAGLLASTLPALAPAQDADAAGGAA